MRPGAGSQDGTFYPLMPGRRNPFMCPLEKALSIFCISRYCLSNWLTSWIDVPLPPAMRRRRLPSMRSGWRRSCGVIEKIMASIRSSWRSSTWTFLSSFMPGVPGMKELKNVQVDDRQLDRIEAMIFSMTPQERRHPDLIDGSRRRRIAGGSGTSIQDVNQLLKQYREMQKMLKAFSSGRMKGFRLPGMSG